MSFIDEVTQRQRIQLTNSRNNQKGQKSKTLDNTKINIIRPTRVQIEEVCLKDAISFNMLNVYNNLIMKAGYEWVGSSKEFTKWYKDMRNYGDPSSINRLFSELIRDRAKYGAGFVEFIPYKNKKGVADIRRINASRMDYARDTRDRIILDNNGRPYGFVMKFDYSTDLTGRSDLIPKDMYEKGFVLKTGSIFLKRERIGIFPLYRLENNYDYIGLIEPAYNDTKSRLDVSRNQVNELKIKSTSQPVIRVGDATHEPTPQMMVDGDQIIENLGAGKGIVLPNHMVLETVEYKSLDTINDAMKRLLFSSAAASGIPLTLITGAGEETNRSTLNKQIEQAVDMLQAQINEFVEDWNLFVTDRIKEENEFDGEYYLKWKEIRYEDKQEESKILLEALKLGALAPEEMRDWMRRNMDVNLNKENFNKRKKGKVKRKPKEKPKNGTTPKK